MAGSRTLFNEATKFVATTSSKPVTWKNSVALRDAAAEVARLKKATGVIINRYVRSGDVKTGSFALENPTDADVERREEMKARR
jgi:hypothetical protein